MEIPIYRYTDMQEPRDCNLRSAACQGSTPETFVTMRSMRALRISAISFLNTAPLMWDFEHGRVPQPGTRRGEGALSAFEISYTVPSQCAEALRAGTADIGIIPAITYATIPGLVVLPDACIAARGAVRSILLVSRRPIEQVRTIAADTSSRTSVALTQVLCEKFWGGARELRPMAPDLGPMLDACDAALLIGDSALRVDRSAFLTYDLAECWRGFTGRPFVFAVWALRMAALAETARERHPAAVLRESRDHGVEPESIAAITRLWAPHVRMAEPQIVEYLTRNIHYHLDSANREGLDLFYRHAAECGLIPEVPPLRFYGLSAAELVGSAGPRQ
jgi:chorismate dehydratase